MKLMIALFALLLGSSLMLSCSEHIPDKHEQLYLDTADSLKLYKEFPYVQKQLISNEKAQDFIDLDFEEFKEKHGMNNAEMEVLSEIMQGHISVAKTINSLNNN